jgi:hypothetical protein
MDIAENSDPYASRRKITKDRYQPLLAELVKFARGREAQQHGLGLGWFIGTGIPKLNASRVAAGLDPIAGDLSEKALNKWLEKYHPELREEFRR